MCPANAFVAPTPAAADFSSMLFDHVYTATTAIELVRRSNFTFAALYLLYPSHWLSRNPKEEVILANGLLLAAGQSAAVGLPPTKGSQSVGSAGGAPWPMFVRSNRCVPLFPT